MRGKAERGFQIMGNEGITPAYAGKRRCAFIPSVPGWDHPRVCGEKIDDATYLMTGEGSPPRMRGKGYAFKGFSQPEGITPAYAGKS